MTITIRDMHTGEVKDYEELFELYTDAVNINLTIEHENGRKRYYVFNKNDYEISYIG